MRSARWLLLAAILGILTVVGLTYRLQQKALKDGAIRRPPALPLNLNASAEDWQWSHTENGRSVVEVRARNFRQVKDSATFELERVELRLFHKEDGEFDRVECARAFFRQAESSLQSDGDVEITLGVPKTGAVEGALVSIHSSGVKFDTKTGTASTDRPAAFQFRNGDGRSVGAAYDPEKRDLHLFSQVEINWRSPNGKGKATKIETGELIYKEAESLIVLFPWARLTRENSVLEASGSTYVRLKQGVIQSVDAEKARGRDSYPNRQLEYSADQVTVHYTEQGEVESIEARPNARLTATSKSSQTNLASQSVHLYFMNREGDSVLDHAVASGAARIESKPPPDGKKPLPDTRILTSETIGMIMRAGGEEIDTIETRAQGQVEFLPNRPDGRRRRMTGERISFAYGDRNQLRSVRAVKVTTITDATKRIPESRTTSENLLAEFDPQTGELDRLEQWDNFRYEEGQRKATANKATFFSQSNVIALETGARVWDPDGSTAADEIRLDQDKDEFTAQGHVSSSRLPEKKKKPGVSPPGQGLLAEGETLQAQADRMTSASRNTLIRYEGNAVLWQGANRIRAGQVVIDRKQRRLEAQDNVRTEFIERPKDAKSRPKYTAVTAAALVYTEQDRLAHYTGGTLFEQAGMRVKSSELRAYLADEGADSTIDRAFADGKVEILQRAKDRTRKGAGEHAEYYVEQGKVILRGGNPVMEDSVKGITRGTELTYFTNDDRLQVSGAAKDPAVSVLTRKSR